MNEAMQVELLSLVGESKSREGPPPTLNFKLVGVLGDLDMEPKDMAKAIEMVKLAIESHKITRLGNKLVGKNRC